MHGLQTPVQRSFDFQVCHHLFIDKARRSFQNFWTIIYLSSTTCDHNAWQIVFNCWTWNSPLIDHFENFSSPSIDLVLKRFRWNALLGDNLRFITNFPWRYRGIFVRNYRFLWKVLFSWTKSCFAPNKASTSSSSFTKPYDFVIVVVLCKTVNMLIINWSVLCASSNLRTALKAGWKNDSSYISRREQNIFTNISTVNCEAIKVAQK